MLAGGIDSHITHTWYYYHFHQIRVVLFINSSQTVVFPILIIFAISRKCCIENTFNFAILSFGRILQNEVFASYLDKIAKKN